MITDTTIPTVAPRSRIVVALDRSEYSEVVLEHAMDMAGRHLAPDIHFLTVVEDANTMDEAKRELAALVLPAFEDFDATDWHIHLHVRSGPIHEEIAMFAAEVRAHLLVLGRFGLHHRLGRLGSIASRVLAQGPCPTLVVGLVDQSPDAQRQCPECVTVRAESNGERWFCTAHIAPDRELSSRWMPSDPATGGGLMW